MNTPIFTLSATNLSNEDEIFDALAVVDYESEDAAIGAARELAGKLASSYDDVCQVTVYGGEWRTPGGDVHGETYDIFTISSKSKEKTMEARKKAGYVQLEVNEYIG